MQVNISNGTLTQLQETLSPSSGYNLPQSITVTGASQSYNSSTGELTLTNIESSVSISATAQSAETKNIWIGANQISKAFLAGSKINKIYLGSSLVYERTPGTVLYTITTNVTDGTYSGATNIETGDTSATVILSANSGYLLPNSITVSGASYNYDSTNGVITLTNFTGNVTITAVCENAIKPYLTFSSSDTFTLNNYGNSKCWDGTLQYSTDTTTWNTWTGTSIQSSQSGSTKYLYIRGSGNTYITGRWAGTTAYFWVLTGSNISCSGNIENLLDYQTVTNGNHPAMATYCYSYMFHNCTALTTAPSLPATTLADYCYRSMFANCTSLTTAPSLPATTLANYCYQSMFYNCTALTTAPSLPATTLAAYCYQSMFYNCTSLTTAPSLPATSISGYCYSSMFYGCTNLTTAPSLPATTLAPGCYNAMFQTCSSLTTAPSLPATTLANNCYYGMFRGCTSLTTPAIMAGGTTQATSASQCCYYMYYGCGALNIYTSSSGHTPFYKAITWSKSSYNTKYQSSYQMFNSCKIDGKLSAADYLTSGTQYYY